MTRHKKVSAETITVLSGVIDLAGHIPPPAPTREELIEKIRRGLEKNIEAKKSAGGKNTTSDAFRIANAEGLRHRFEALIRDLPEGFDLAPVYYVRAPAERKEPVFDEYSFQVRPRFLRYLALNHADELSSLGICQHGIDRMREGLDPLRADGAYYSVSVDHIIERSGSGKWTLMRARDPLDPEHEAEVSPVNHFRNMILIPEEVHQKKNALNSLQTQDILSEGDGRWILMLVPVTTDGSSGFVAKRQKNGLGCAELTMKDRLSNTGYMSMQAARMIKMLRQNQGIAATLTTLSALAEMRGKDLTQAANDNISKPSEDRLVFKGTFAEAFEQALRLNPSLHQRTHQLIRPALRDFSESLRLLFNDSMGLYHDKSGSAKAQEQRHQAFDAFVRLYHSKPVNALRKDVRMLPVPEAGQLRHLFGKIDESLQRHRPTARPAKPHPSHKQKHKKPRR